MLAQIPATLLVTTYQAGKLVVIRATGGRISTLLRSFDQPMGLAADARQLVIGTRNQIWRLRNAPDIASQLEPAGTHDACYLPRSSHVTGDIRGHEIAWIGDELWLVNTRFSCLCTLDPDYSFVPRWRPPFVTALVAEDRCHLNGLAVDAPVVTSQQGRRDVAMKLPRFATALGETNTPEGWRDSKINGGIVMDVASGEVIARGLSMPHSPRIHDGKLWVLNSGTGSLLTVDPDSGRSENIVQLPGYTRGMALIGRYAFVGLSKIRESSTFGGLPIADNVKDLQCGVWVIDVTAGKIVAFLRFDSGIEEIFEVQLLPNIRFPAVIGFQKETIHGAFVIPS